MKIYISKRAKKVLDEVQSKRQILIKEAIKNLPNGDVKPLNGKPPLKRLRVGSYRIIFEITKDGAIAIHKIEPRGSVYKGGL